MMQLHLFVRYICAIVLGFTAVMVEAQEVTLLHKGLTLNANLELTKDKKPGDGVILITHGGLVHNGVEIVVDLQNQLKERGYNTLAINLSLGLNNRHNEYDCQVTHHHRNIDAADEIGVWVYWLKQQGAKQATLLGHSRGGAQTALYVAEQDNALMKNVVLIAPAIRENTDAAGYLQRYGKPLAPLLAKAQKLIKDGKGDTVLEHIGILNCADTSATANSFVAYNGQDPRLDTPYLMHKIKKPILVVVAGNDEIVIGLEKKLTSLASDKRVQMKVIDGADHFFRDLYTDDLVEVIDAFLKVNGG